MITRSVFRARTFDYCHHFAALCIYKPFHTNIGTMNGQNDKLFIGKEQTQKYAAFRPRYPPAVYQSIVRHCIGSDDTNATESKDLKCTGFALDIGCGPGLSTIPLAKYFNKVIGVDVSQQQIDNAPTHVENVSFRVSPAEELSFVEDQSVDLVSIAQALHWIDLDRFYPEVNRVLKPGGYVAAYGYSFFQTKVKEIQDYLTHIHIERLANSWSARRAHVDNCYRDLPAPYNNGIWIQNNDHFIEKSLSLEALIGYLGSWSAINTFHQQNPQVDLLAEIKDRLSSIQLKSGKTADDTIQVSWPVFIRLSQKPH